jgi:hypothetical protein
MTAEISVRRSGRDRRPTTTYYDDAKHALEQRLRSNSPKKKGYVSVFHVLRPCETRLLNEFNGSKHLQLVVPHPLLVFHESLT